MTKDKEEQAPVAPKGFFKKAFLWLLFWAAIGGGVYFVWKNPEVLEKVQKMVEAKPVEQTNFVEGEDKAYMDLSYRIASIEDGLLALTQKVGEVSPMAGGEDVSSEMIALKDKYDLMSGQIQTKADMGVLISLSNRVDVMEAKVKDIARVSDKGALVLTATMLVKEKADMGETFLFEAEVLKELSKDDETVKAQVEFIAKAASKGVVSLTEINNEFLEIAQDMAKDNEKNLTWKGKVKAKLDEVVQIKNTDAKKEIVKNPVEMTEQYLSEGALAKAVLEASRIENKSEKLNEWIVKAREKLDFNAAISEISAHSLALMKINQIKAAE